MNKLISLGAGLKDKKLSEVNKVIVENFKRNEGRMGLRLFFPLFPRVVSWVGWT